MWCYVTCWCFEYLQIECCITCAALWCMPADVTSVNICLGWAICFGEKKLYFTEHKNVCGQQLAARMLIRIRSNSSLYKGSAAKHQTAERGKCLKCQTGLTVILNPTKLLTLTFYLNLNPNLKPVQHSRRLPRSAFRHSARCVIPLHYGRWYSSGLRKHSWQANVLAEGKTRKYNCNCSGWYSYGHQSNSHDAILSGSRRTNGGKYANSSGHRINHYYAIYTALARDKSLEEQSISQNSAENNFVAGAQFCKKKSEAHLKSCAYMFLNLNVRKSSKKLLLQITPQLHNVRLCVPLPSYTTRLHRHTVSCLFFVLLTLKPGE